MKVRIFRDETGVTVLVNVPCSRIWVTRVFRPGGYDPAVVRWSGGNTGPDNALEFAHALTRAVGYAERLDLDIDVDIREQG